MSSRNIPSMQNRYHQGRSIMTHFIEINFISNLLVCSYQNTAKRYVERGRPMIPLPGQMQWRITH